MPSRADAQFRVTTWPGYAVRPLKVQARPATVDGEWLRFDLATSGHPYVEVPEEVRLRELLDIDTADIEALAAFVSTYGRLTRLDDLTSDLGIDGTHYIRLVAETAARNGRSAPRTLGRMDAPGPRLDGPGKSKSLRPFDIVHADDVAVRIRVLRQLTRHALAHASGDYERDVWPECRSEEQAWSRFTHLANAALREFHVRVYVDRGHPEAHIGGPQPSVYEVAVLQLVNDMTDELDYNTCPAEGCGRIFIRSRGKRVKAFNRTTGVTFCSDVCANAQRQREYRRRRKLEQEGGTS